MADLIDRQAAIDALNKHSVMFEFHLPHEFHEVKEEIRGLPSAQPTQTNAPNALQSLDCISRQAAIESLTREYNRKGSGEGLRLAWIEKAINEVPSAEPKTGRWMFPDPPIHKPICSECRKPCIGLHAFDYKLTDYCPNCGAMMEGEDDC